MKSLERVGAIVLGLIALIAILPIVGALTTDGSIIVWRLVVVLIILPCAAVGSVVLWRRSSRPTQAAPPVTPPAPPAPPAPPDSPAP